MIKSNLAVAMAKKRKNLSQVSRDTGLSRTTLHRLYHDQARGVSFDTIERMCAYLGCDVCDLFEYQREGN